MSLSRNRVTLSAPPKSNVGLSVHPTYGTASSGTTTASQNDYRVNPKIILALQVDEHGFVHEADRDYYFRLIRARLENRQCFDCHHRNPTWVSLAFGLFLCLSCSGNHRRLGTHITFVRSCELDNFTPEQLLRLERTGNGSAILYLKSHGCERFEYGSKLAARYKHDLDKQLQAVAAAAATTSPYQVPDSNGISTEETPRDIQSSLLSESCTGIPAANLQPPPKGGHLHYSTDIPSRRCVDPQACSSRSGSDGGASSVGATGVLSSAAGSQDSASYGPASDGAQEDLLLPGFGGALTASSASREVISAVDANNSAGGNRVAGPVATAATAAAIVPPSSGLGQPKTKKLDSDFDFDAIEREVSSLQLLQKQQLQEPDRNPGREVVTGLGTVLWPRSSGTAANEGCGNGSRLAAAETAAAVPFSGGPRVAQQSLSAPSQSFFNSKAISSTEYFRRVDNAQCGGGIGSTAERVDMQTRMHRFKDCTAISSDAFLADDPSCISALQMKGIHPGELVRENPYSSPNGTAAQLIDDETLTRLSQLGDQAQQRIKVLAAGAQETMSRAKGWISSLIFDEHGTGSL